MKKKLIYLTIAAAAIAFSSCKKFLEVQPQDKYVAGQIFANENAIQQALNGIYQNMASNNLYGANLTTTILEAMAQRYNTSTSLVTTQFKLFQSYNYTDVTSTDVLNTIWTSTYANILQTNQFIQQIDVASNNGVIPAAKAAELKGEAIGLRALMHFDMLRLFGPVYKNTPTGAAIPYYTKAEAVAQPILPASQAIDSVLADLNSAKTLLAADPVITTGTNIASTDFYNGTRNQRLNYYSIIALQARVYLYKGDNANAYTTAKQALAAIDSKFTWLLYTSILSNVNPDRIFSTEVLFGLYNQNLYLNYQAYFSTALQSNDILMGLPARISSTFEANQNDYRYKTTWTEYTFPNGIAGSVFNKYADLTDVSKPWRFVQPMIRKSELYYILAETEPDLATAFGYLNTVRNNRGLLSLATGTAATLTTEIQKEYQKEFAGEGQLFYFYKRKAVATIPSGNNTGNASPAPNYLIPLPLSETTPR